jgi:two-component system, OmpR family, alkaline phosphatase synthesis response regulator PhoP
MNPSPRILVVDDNRSIVNLIQVVLQKAGYRVLTAFDGLQGLEAARKEKPDLVILDVMMPKMDGYRVCQALQADPDTNAIPILFLTARGQLGDNQRKSVYGGMAVPITERMIGYDAGAIEFMSKPVKAKELVQRVKAILWLGLGSGPAQAE